MAKFPEYTAPASTTDIRPTETGIEATTQGARRIGAFYSQAGEDMTGMGSRLGTAIAQATDQAVKFEATREVSAGSKNFANLVARKTDEWNEIARNSDPNDPSIKQKFMEKLEPDLEKFASDGFLTQEGQKWARERVDQFRLHMATKTSADMVSNATKAAAVNANETVDRESGAAFKDDTQLRNAMGNVRSAIEFHYNNSPNLGADAGGDKVKRINEAMTQLVRAAAVGYIYRTGQVPKWIEDDDIKPYVKPEEIAGFQKAADAQTRAKLATQKSLELTERQLADRKAHTDAGQVMSNDIKYDPATGQTVIDPQFFQHALDIAKNNPNAAGAADVARTLFSWGQMEQNKEDIPRSDLKVRADLQARIGARDNPTTEIEILKAKVNKQLTRADTLDLLNLNKATAERPYGEQLKIQREKFIKAHERMIDAAYKVQTGEHSLMGSERMYEFEAYVRQRELDMIKQNKDPATLYQPSSPDYIGRPEDMAKWHVSSQEALDYENKIQKQDQAAYQQRREEQQRKDEALRAGADVKASIEKILRNNTDKAGQLSGDDAEALNWVRQNMTDVKALRILREKLKWK